MTFRVRDYGEEYEHDDYNVTFSAWGYVQVDIEGTVEELPWKYAERVDAEVELEGTVFSFEGSVNVHREEVEWGEHIVHIEVFGSEYIPDREVAA